MRNVVVLLDYPHPCGGGEAHSPTPQIQKRMTDRLLANRRSDRPHIPSRIWGGGVSHWPCCGSRLRFCNRLRARVATVRAEHAGVASYATWVEETFPDSQLRSLALQGGTIIRQRGGYTMLRSKCRGDRCAIARANSSSPKSIIPYSRPNIQR